MKLGALMAESFCERILSCAKQVLHAVPEMRKNHAKYAKA